MSGSGEWSQRLDGVFAAVPTPFDDRGVAGEELARNIGMWAMTPLAGVLVLGSNGEAPSLSPAERRAVVAAACEAAGDELLVLAGAGAVSTAQTTELVRAAADAGAAAAVIMPPPFYQPWLDEAALRRHFEAVADAAELPLLLYNVPRLTGIELTPDLVAALASHPAIVGIKDSGGRLDRLARFVAGAPADFAVLAGSAPYALPAYAVGAWGVITAAAGLFPFESHELHEQVRSGRLEAARSTASRLAAAHEGIVGRFGVPGLKAALAMLGYYGGPPRPPLPPVPAEAEVAIKEILQEQRLVGC